MLTKHDQEKLNFMQKNNKGKCAYNSAKKCNGLCNNCPYDFSISATPKYVSSNYVSNYGNNYNDYEEAILIRQENYDL